MCHGVLHKNEGFSLSLHSGSADAVKNNNNTSNDNQMNSNTNHMNNSNCNNSLTTGELRHFCDDPVCLDGAASPRSPAILLGLQPL